MSGKVIELFPVKPSQDDEEEVIVSYHCVDDYEKGVHDLVYIEGDAKLVLLRMELFRGSSPNLAMTADQALDLADWLIGSAEELGVRRK